MEYEYELGSAIGNCVQRLLAGISSNCRFRLQETIVNSEAVRRGKVGIEHQEEVGVAQSEAVFENCIQRLLAEIQ